MGKNLIVQRRGRGTPTFKAATHKRVAPSKYPSLSPSERDTNIKGVISDLLHDPGRGTPLALVKLENGAVYYTVPPEGVSSGQEIAIGATAPVKVGNMLPLGRIPEGTIVCNVETKPGDGGKMARASGAYVTVVAHTPTGTIVKLPSGKSASLSDGCRATVGVIAGAGRGEKPFLRAGKKLHWVRSKGGKYSRVRGVAMVAASHPHGGGAHQHPGKPTTVSRHTPPGRKVGLIAAKRTGRRRRSRKM